MAFLTLSIVAPDDLPPLTEISNATLTGFPGTRISEPVPFKFGNTGVSISFQFEAELANFINIPKAYFDAVYQREPVDSKEFTESVIFKNSVEMVEQLKPPNMKPMNPPVITKSCEVRILERSYGQAWRSTRRMVICPSAAEKEPQCTEFFMPLSRVQIGREDVSRQVLLKWSDTCQERSDKTDGSYNTLHSHVYDDSAPNIGVAIHFRSQQAAEEFEKAILELNFRPDFAWSQPSSSGRIYDVVDTETDQKQYKAVAIFQNRSSWRYSDVYYLYRDTDFAYEHSSLSVRFPRAYYTDYISNHVDQLYHADGPVTFSHCEKKTGQAIIEFNNETVSHSFLSALSPLYELQYSRRIHSLSTKSKSLFGSKKSSKGGAEIQLWRRGNGFQLAARWDDHIPEKWLTMTLSSDCSHVAKEGFKVNFPKMAYTRGATLDMMNILARSLKSHHVGNREGTFSIVFQNAKGEYSSTPVGGTTLNMNSITDREQFLAVLQGRPLSAIM